MPLGQTVAMTFTDQLFTSFGMHRAWQRAIA